MLKYPLKVLRYYFLGVKCLKLIRIIFLGPGIIRLFLTQEPFLSRTFGRPPYSNGQLVSSCRQSVQQNFAPTPNRDTLLYLAVIDFVVLGQVTLLGNSDARQYLALNRACFYLFGMN